jgi:hypothetical protein
MPQPSDAAIRQAITALTRRRAAAGGSACPSEVARALEARRWRALMARVRAVAWTMVASGELHVLQRGAVLANPEDVHGPIRLRWCG